MSTPGKTPSLIAAVGLVAVAATSLAGCQVIRAMFQMDSDRRAPAFGIELAPAEQKVEQTSHDEPAREPAAQSESDRATAETPDAPSAWSRLFGRFTRPKRIPLPRTDLDEPTGQQATDQTETGQADSGPTETGVVHGPGDSEPVQLGFEE